jgi:ADP-dependent NAD(P)H-hydrate dehydratase / NAD(P)H-hydrate epimerase
MKITTAAEMREIDRITTERFGVPSLTLMENAGTAVARFVLSRYPHAERVGVVCGKGNNGGDGFVAARKLYDSEKRISLLLLAKPAELRGDAAEMFKRLPAAIDVLDVSSVSALKGAAAEAVLNSDVLLDGILGTGFRPPVTGLYADAIAGINSSSAPVVAIDIPSGVDADAVTSNTDVVARADAVVTFTAPRPAHIFGRLTSGPVVVVSIGSPDEAIASALDLNVITASDLTQMLARRPRDSNKGMYGHVLVIGGSLGKSGAAVMAGISALRSGAGLSSIATPKSVLATVAGFYPELMTEPLEETEAGTISLRAFEYGRMDALIDGKTVLAIGPGVSRNEETSQLVRNLVAKYQKAIVLDADGLNAFQGHIQHLTGEGRAFVITPHPGEMARLVGTTVPDVQRDRIGIARSFAREHHVIVVLKGDRTLVAAPDGKIWVNTTGNPGMATGGTGDILTGMVAGLVAQHPHEALLAACAAVYLHGLAGDVACESMGEHCLTATDLLQALPEAFRRAQLWSTQRPVTVLMEACTAVQYRGSQ